MEIDALVRKRTKLRKKIKTLVDVLLILLAVLFIVVAFSITLIQDDTIMKGMENFRYGLFAFGLLICGTAIIINMYNTSRNKSSKFIVQKKKEK
jgi:hypothetical protein